MVITGLHLVMNSSAPNKCEMTEITKVTQNNTDMYTKERSQQTFEVVNHETRPQSR